MPPLYLEHRHPQFPRLQGDLALVKDRLRVVLQQAPDLEQVRRWTATLGAEGRWPDIDYQDQDRNNWKTPEHLHRLLTLAQARVADAADDSVRRTLHLGLDLWLREDFTNPNWWWNQIGAPGALSQLALLVEADLSPAQRSKAIEILNRAQLGMTGQNLVWVADITLRRGLLEQDPEVVGRAFAAVARVIEVSPAEGIQADFSFHQHGPCLYSHGYGAAFAQDCARLAVLAAGTGFAFAPAQVALLTGLVLDGHQWLSRGAAPEYGAIGRQLARPAQSTAYLRQVAGDLLQLPTGRESELQALCDYLDGKAGPPLCGNRHFWRSDIMAHHRSGYYASARIFSDRLVNTDRPHNGEAFKSHHIADGCTLILRHGEEYRDLFPLWDWQQIPGTTVELTPQLEGEVCRQGSRAFAGGVSDGLSGLAAFDFERDGLTARKCWGFFDEGLACLGAGISCTSTHPVITTLNQCALRGEVVARIGGETRTMPPGAHLLENPEWLHHDRIAYLFPQPARVHLELGPRTGSWRQISHNSSDEPLTRELFTLWLDHGAGPQQASYVYWILPDISLSAVSAPPCRILGNQPQLQALRHEGLGLTTIAFYEAGRLDLPQGGSLAVNQPCLVLLREGHSEWAVSVSNPENRQLQVKVALTAESRAPRQLRFDLPGGPEAGRSLTQTLNPFSRG